MSFFPLVFPPRFKPPGRKRAAVSAYFTVPALLIPGPSEDTCFDGASTPPCPSWPLPPHCFLWIILKSRRPPRCRPARIIMKTQGGLAAGLLAALTASPPPAAFKSAPLELFIPRRCSSCCRRPHLPCGCRCLDVVVFLAPPLSAERQLIGRAGRQPINFSTWRLSRWMLVCGLHGLVLLASSHYRIQCTFIARLSSSVQS